jgi:integrase
LSAYRVGRRERSRTLGPWGVLTIDQARLEARRQLLGLVQGRDPLEERARGRRGITVGEIVKLYIERHAKPRKKTWKKDDSRLTRHVLPRWRGRSADSIKRADVASLHEDVGKRSGKIEANRTLEVVRKMWNLASAWGFLDEAAPNPARGIERFREHKRDRWLKPEELKRLAEAIDKERDAYARAAIWLYLLTGLRKQELLTLRRADIDWDRSELRLEDTKAGRPHYLPLSAPALELLRSIPQTEGNPYVFAGRKAGHHYVNIEKPWVRIRAAAEIPDVHLHDLRRTVGSWLAQSGNSLHLIGRVLNQTSPATTAVYARFGNDHVRDALDAHAARILGAAGKLPKADVMEFKR